MKKTEYAIVDIETTGGNASGSRITEIAIIIHDGEKIIDRWETLVNPEKDIPLPIFALTGINNEMVRDAPVFDDIAPTVFEMLSDRIFVAHSVNFDYSFVRHQLEQSGFKWTAKKLCTVRAARKIRPGLGSYSLGNLCRSLGIEIINRHRAGGDADATAILFSRLLEWDVDGALDKMVKKTAQDQRLPPNLSPDDFERLPHKPGVYYFHDQAKKVIYVGKAVNLKKRVASHFSGHNIRSQRQNFLREIHGISFEVCATELMALLLECAEIRKLWPEYNRALKRFEPKFGLYEYEARSGYRYLAVGKLGKFQSCIQPFNDLYEAITQLRSLSEQFKIDQRFCKYGRPVEGELLVRRDTSDVPDILQHNKRVTDALEFLQQRRESFAIIDKGRSDDERSCVWIEDGAFYGMGHISSDVTIVDISDVKNHVTRYRSNQYVMQLIGSYVKKYPGKVVFKRLDQAIEH
jgi:DNA polymerase III subunit epsilon